MNRELLKDLFKELKQLNKNVKMYPNLNLGYVEDLVRGMLVKIQTDVPDIELENVGFYQEKTELDQFWTDYYENKRRVQATRNWWSLFGEQFRCIAYHMQLKKMKAELDSRIGWKETAEAAQQMSAKWKAVAKKYRPKARFWDISLGKK